MGSVQISEIQLAFGDRELLKGIGYSLASGKKAALTGGNGTGKSTLMKIIAGLSKADSGRVSKSRGCRVSYLPQSGLVHQGIPLVEETEKAWDFLLPDIKRKESIEHLLSETDEDDPATESLVEEHHDLSEKIIESGYYSRRESLEVVLQGLGFSREDFQKHCEEFSGGWQMRIALAKVLLEKPDILLLDEPTNYLDIEARDWLEGFLQGFSGGLLMVSHDRYFLDVTVNEVAELFNGDLHVFKGNYSGYLVKRELELQELLKKFEQQQEEISRIEYFINKFRSNASKATQVQSRVKYLEKLPRIEIPESMKKIHFSFPKPPRSGKQVLTIEKVGKSYGDFNVFKDLDLIIEKEEKLLIAGKNGAGKSTLMRLIAEVDKDFDGVIKPGADVKIGYFSQDIESTIKGELSVLEEMELSAPTHLIPDLRNLLGAFLFRGDDIYKSVSVLSGGEKSRLALLKLLLYPVNLLVLDEPTNHLDMNSKNVLLNALKSYEGTLVFVSHDRYFIENVATKVLEMNTSGPRIFHGDYEYYQWKIGEESREAEQEAANFSGQTASLDKNQGKKAREEEKQLKSKLRKLERESQSLLSEIEELDDEKKNLENQLSDPSVYSDGEKSREVQNRIEEIIRKQEDAGKKWEEVEEELDSIGP
ncbi:MAG: ATP-binding cassette domain-containing protein [Spirochaetales bacterium]|nr:ATP-binding cassette domain-containing protein [Spirochaetales bacterium]